MRLNGFPTMSKLPKQWTPEEDEKLQQQVMLMSSEGRANDWSAIAAPLPGRSNKDCRKRWCNCLVGGLHKGPWSSSEDQRLVESVKLHGEQWPQVAEDVDGRSADQCAKRWHHSLNPALDHSKWAAEEEETLLKAVEKHGRSWKHIQTYYFPGRSTNNVKNRYVTLSRKQDSAPDGNFRPTSRATNEANEDNSSRSNSSSTSSLFPNAAMIPSSGEPSPGRTSLNTTFSFDNFPGSETISPQDLSMDTFNAISYDTLFDFTPDNTIMTDSTPTADNMGFQQTLPEQTSGAPIESQTLDALPMDTTPLQSDQCSDKLVLNIDNPSVDTVTGVIGVLAKSNTKFSMEKS